MDSAFAKSLAADITRYLSLYLLLLKEMRTLDEHTVRSWFPDSRKGLRNLMKSLAETSRVLHLVIEEDDLASDPVAVHALKLVHSLLESVVLIETIESLAALEKAPLLAEPQIEKMLSSSALRSLLGPSA